MERKDIWKRKIKDWENSGFTRSEFCRRNNISLSTFDYWKSKIRKELKSIGETNLVKLPMILKPSQGIPFSIEYPSGYKIHIPSDYDSHLLIRLVTDLKEILK